MRQSFRNLVVRAVSAAALLGVVTVAGSASAQTQITGCCYGPSCGNQDSVACKASGGTPLDSTCKNANDPRCGSCSDIPEAAPRGLCNAYCDRLNCPAGHPGQACNQLRKNWMRATSLTAFPCDVQDRPVCCQCPGALPTCSSAKRCLKAQCQIIDRCVDGKCPEPQCCECPNRDPVCSDNILPSRCKAAGCMPEAGAVCTEYGCERCPCGTECKDAAGNVGRCVNVPGAEECDCKVPAPCNFDAAGVCGGACDDSTDTCMTVTDPAGNVKCECAQPCSRNAAEQCGGACSRPGYVCADVEGECTCTPPPDPCLNRVPCDATCVDPSGNAGICRDTATGCRCSPPSTECPPTTAACAGPCVTADNKPGKCTPGVDGVPCACQPPPQPCNESDPDTCDGLCTVAGTLCLPDPNDGQCRCQPPPKCEDGAAPQCGGPCPSGHICTGTANGGSCVCVPRCEISGPQCGGPCPEGLHCTPTATGGACVCQPPTPCEATTAPQCGGFCPEGLVCTGTATGAPCACLPPRACEDSAPTCGGLCPPGSSCAITPNGCACGPDVPCDASCSTNCRVGGLPGFCTLTATGCECKLATAQ